MYELARESWSRLCPMPFSSRIREQSLCFVILFRVGPCKCSLKRHWERLIFLSQTFPFIRVDRSRIRNAIRAISRAFSTEKINRARSRGIASLISSPLEAAAPDGRNRRRKKRFALYGAPREHVDYWTLRVVLGPGPPSERRMFTHRVPAFATIDRRECDHLAGYYITWYNCNNIATQLLHSPFVMQWWVRYWTLDCLYAIRKWKKHYCLQR